MAGGQAPKARRARRGDGTSQKAVHAVRRTVSAERSGLQLLPGTGAGIQYAQLTGTPEESPRARNRARPTRHGGLIADDSQMTRLLSIAVTVIEVEEGAYRWRLVELGDEEQGQGWSVLRQQPRPMKTYKAAMAAGLLELQKLIDDLDAGPREEEEPGSARRAKKKGEPVFGFGFGLPKIG